jgi:alpha-galactosidase
VDYRVQDLQRRMEKSRQYLSKELSLDDKPSGEEGILLIKSLLGLVRTVSNVNIPNVGQIANLPIGAIVETNALFERDHIAPVFAGIIPDNVLALITPHVNNHDRILNAALTCDRRLALEAFCQDPLVTINASDALDLFNEMLENTKKYLPSQWFQN